MVRVLGAFAPLLVLAQAALAACPMAELTRRGLAPPDLAERYARGEGLPADHLVNNKKRQLGTPGDTGATDGHDGPALLDPLSGVLSPLGLGGLTPRSDAKREHLEEQAAHILARRNEPDHEVDINKAILTPKAHKRHVQERGLVGGLLAPLSGILEHLDIPTPQESGLKEIPGDDPNHQYQAPGPTDIRGDCPTLNTLANHGYLDRSGITTFAEAANAIQTAYSMAFDISIVLSAFGLLAGGDVVTGKYSIAGQDDRVPNTIGPAYGIDRHGTFELDGSISRSDKGLGDNHSFNVTKWNALVDDANRYGGGYFNIEAFKRNAATQAKTSRATNPEYSNGGNFIFNGATRALTLRPLPNGTTPDVADWANIAPFYLNETFPEKWYRRPNSYSFVDLLADAADILLFDLQPLGRNEGNRFVPIEANLPTAPRDLGCAGFSILANAIPGQLAPEFTAAGTAVIDQLLSPVFGSANCSLKSFNQPGLNNNASNQATVTSESGSGVTGKGQHENVHKTTVYSGSGNTTVHQNPGYRVGSRRAVVKDV